MDSTIILNSQQKIAAEHQYGPALVVAGAGSGKTSVVVQRVLRLVKEKNVDPESILVVTFTNKACREIKDRLKIQGVSVLTFHKLGLKLIRDYSRNIQRLSFSIYDEKDAISIIKKILVRKGVDPKKASNYWEIFDAVRRDSKYISREQESQSIIDFMDVKNLQDVDFVFKEYIEACKSNSAIDLTDMLYIPARTLITDHFFNQRIKNLWEYAIIDEYQDTSNVESMLISRIFGENANIMCVGDPNQSIYEWRGACLKNILQFPNEFKNTKIIKLNQNYRSCEEILAFANQIISDNNNCSLVSQNNLKALFYGNKPTLCKFISDIHEAGFIAKLTEKYLSENKSVAVIYRTNGQSRVIETEFMNKAVPYSVKGGLSLYEKEESKSLVSYIAMLSKNHSDILSFQRAISTPRRGIGEKKIEEIFSVFNLLDKQDIIEVLRDSVDGKIDGVKWSKKSKEGMIDFLESIETARKIYETEDLHGAVKYLVDKTGIKEYFLAKEDGRVRVANLDHIERSLKRSKITVGDFLDKITLDKGDFEINENKALLATIHSVKGLEFDVVFLCGAEEGLLPHLNAYSIDEERRLFYVAVTRAKSNLYISSVLHRRINGAQMQQKISRFFKNIPEESYKTYDRSESIDRVNRFFRRRSR